MRKKFWGLLLISTFVFALTACGVEKTQTNGENKPEEEKVVYKELTAPQQSDAVSTATGETNPRIVETKYETKDVIVADIVPTEDGYVVDPTGKTDSTAGIQQALYDVYDAGGGTVYLPAGNYAITGDIYIPPYCILQGDWQDPDEGGTEYGTIISIWSEPEDTELSGTFCLGSCAGAVGLTIYYPKQNLDCVMPYQYTFFTKCFAQDRRLMTVKNVTMINSYRGIGTMMQESHEQFQIDNVKGTFLRCGYYGTNESDVGYVKKFTASPKYWAEAAADCMNRETKSRIIDYTEQYAVGIMAGDIEWTVFNSILIENCKIGVQTVPGARIAFCGAFYDLTIKDCKQGIQIDALETRMGFTVVNGTVDGGIAVNCKGMVKLASVKVNGEITKVDEATVMVDDTDLSAVEVDLDRYHTKQKANLVVAKLSTGLFYDAGPDLQKAIDEVAAQGGGIVYVPGGNYRFWTPIHIPANVELRGSSSIATRDINSALNGTVFLCYYGDDETSKPEDTAFITLEGENAGVNGIRITYPENGSVGTDWNSTYTIRGTADKVYVINSMITASAYGIDFSDCDDHYIGNMNTTCYYNVYRVGGKNGTIMTSNFNNTVQLRTSNIGLVDWILEKNSKAEITDPVLREYCEYIIVENANNELICQTFGYGVATPITNINSENTVLCNIGNDNIGTTCPQIYLDGGSIIGMNIQRYNGYSYELVKGKLDLYCRIGLSEIGEKTVNKEK